MTCPSDLVAVCSIDEIPPYANFEAFDLAGGDATDNCGIDESTFRLLSETSSGSCPITVTRVYEVQDSCGNTATCTQLVTVNDLINPTIAGCPSDLILECGTNYATLIDDWINNAETSILNNSNDNCTSNLTVDNDYDDTLPTVICTEDGDGLIVTFTVTDACGNLDQCAAKIVIRDITPPVVTDASDQVVECDGAGNTAQLNAWLNSNGGASANDDCSAVTWTNNFDELSDLCGATGSATITFTATDVCGNSSTTTATFTIQDTTDPVFDGVPSDITVECDNVPAAASPTATDNCDADVEITYSEVRTDGNCPDNYTLTRTWTATG